MNPLKDTYPPTHVKRETIHPSNLRADAGDSYFPSRALNYFNGYNSSRGILFAPFFRQFRGNQIHALLGLAQPMLSGTIAEAHTKDEARKGSHSARIRDLCNPFSLTSLLLFWSVLHHLLNC